MECQIVFSLFYSKEGTSLGHGSRRGQPIRAKTGSKTRFSVVKEHALKYHGLNWYSDRYDFFRSIITVFA